MFGDVRRATERETQEQVAVKVMSLDQEHPARKELTMLSELDHPNIVKLLDAMIHRTQLPETARAAPYLCIVMDYVPNSYSLASLITTVGQVGTDLCLFC